MGSVGPPEPRAQGDSNPLHAGYDQPRDSNRVWVVQGALDEAQSESTVHEVPLNWLVPAVLTAVFCFPPTGIAAIFFARKANKAKAGRDMKKIRHISGIARFLVFLSLLIGIVCYAVLISVI